MRIVLSKMLNRSAI